MYLYVLNLHMYLSQASLQLLHEAGRHMAYYYNICNHYSCSIMVATLANFPIK